MSALFFSFLKCATIGFRHNAFLPDHVLHFLDVVLSSETEDWLLRCQEIPLRASTSSADRSTGKLFDKVAMRHEPKTGGPDGLSGR